jgi:hypothetical protein
MADDSFLASGQKQELVVTQKKDSGGLVPEKHDFNVANFAGGLNNRDADSLVKDNQLTDCMNVIANDVGSLEKRSGYKALLTTALGSAIVSIFEYNKYDGTTIYLVSTATGLFKLSSDMKTTTAVALPSGVTLTTGIKAFFTMKDKCYMLTGTTYLKYDGTTVTECAYTPTTNENTTYGANVLDGPKRCTLAVMHRGRVYLTGDTQQPNRVYFTVGDNPEYVPATYLLNFYTELGDKITGIHPFAETIILTKSRSIGFLDISTSTTDPTLWVFRRLNVHTGSVSGKAVVPISNYLVYASNDGFYALTDVNVIGALATVPISQLIPKTIRDLDDFSQAVAIYYKGKYFCKVKDKVLVYDYLSDYKPWWVWDGIDATQFLVTNKNELLFSANDGQLYKFDETMYRDKAVTDANGNFTAGTAITAYAFTKNFDLGYPSSIKQFKKFRMLVRNYGSEYLAGSSIEFTCLVDWMEVLHTNILTEISLWGYAQWGDKFYPFTKGELKPVRLPKRGRTFMFGFRNSNIDQPFTLFELIGKFKEKTI